MSDYTPPPPYDPYQSPMSPGGFQTPPMAMRPRRPSGAVVGAAVVSFVYGGLALTCGSVWTCFGTAAGSIMGFAASQNRGPAGDAVRGAAVAVGAVVIAYGVTHLIVGGMAIGGGVGALRLRNWGRILCLVAAGLAILLTVLALVLVFLAGDIVTSCIAFVVHLAYAITTLVLLLMPRVAAEFD